MSALKTLPKPEKRKPEPTLDVSFIIPAKNSSHVIESTLKKVSSFLEKINITYEILAIPTYCSDGSDTSAEILESFKDQIPHLKIVMHHRPVGKGAALQTGVLNSKGRLIFTTDADLPYDLSFFIRAFELLTEKDIDFVHGNRRLSESIFDLPSELLGLAYKRHHLSLIFNRMFRLLFRFQTTDSQAGIKAMNHVFAKEVFDNLVCPGFFYDIEYFIAARRFGFKTQELPVTLRLNTEKSTVRVMREIGLALYWLFKLWLESLKKSEQRPDPRHAQ